MLTNNYYYDQDDYYDYAYSANIRRFYSPVVGYSYYDPFYTNLYWYDYNPVHWGTSIYLGYNWWRRQPSTISPSVTAVSPIGIGWNSWGWGLGWNRPGHTTPGTVLPGAGTTWGWGGGWNNGYWERLQQRFTGMAITTAFTGTYGNP